MSILTFKENDQYKLFVDSFNYIVLSVSFVESNVVWLCAKDCGYQSYKYNLKTGKLHKWHRDHAWDAVDMQYGFNKLSSNDVWKERQQPSVDYAGFYGD